MRVSLGTTEAQKARRGTQRVVSVGLCGFLVLQMPVADSAVVISARGIMSLRNIASQPQGTGSVAEEVHWTDEKTTE